MRNNNVQYAFVVFFMFVLFLGPVAAQRREQQNIIVFLVDDMGWQDTSVPFSGQVTANNKKYRTPNMERLAKSGITFTNAYATPVCTPSRVSLITGMNAAHHHVTNWTSPIKDNNTDATDSSLNPAPWLINGYSPVPGVANTVYATALPSILKDNGYFTIHIGKAHWGAQGTPGAEPRNLGFVVNISGHAAGHPQSYLSEDAYGNLPGKNSAQSVPDLEQYYNTGVFLTEALTLEALKALEFPVTHHQPFFLYLAHYAVHVPLMADKLFYKDYLDRGLDSTEAKYAALIEGMDKSLGDVMKYLDSHDLKKNTTIIFLSDNGGLALAPPRGGDPYVQNAPLKAGKGSVYEGGIRIPMIVSSPLFTEKDKRSASPIIIEDLFPSILELTGVKGVPTVQTIDGKSFVGNLQKPDTIDAERVLLWHYPNRWVASDPPGTNYFSAVRQGKWKLVYNMKTQKSELYDLSSDLGEEHDLSLEKVEVTNTLVNILGQQLLHYLAPMPSFKESSKKINYPKIK